VVARAERAAGHVPEEAAHVLEEVVRAAVLEESAAVLEGARHAVAGSEEADRVAAELVADLAAGHAAAAEGFPAICRLDLVAVAVEYAAAEELAVVASETVDSPVAAAEGLQAATDRLDRAMGVEAVEDLQAAIGRLAMVVAETAAWVQEAAFRAPAAVTCAAEAVAA
jgi:hypothetical protein